MRKLGLQVHRLGIYGMGLTGVEATGKGPNNDTSCPETRRLKNANRNKIPATFFINRVLQKWLGVPYVSLCELSDAGGR